MNILWFLDKEFDYALSTSARLETIKYLEKNNNITVVTNFRKVKKYSYDIKSSLIYLDRINLPFIETISLYYQHLKFLNKEIDLKRVDTVYINSKNLFLLKKLIKQRKDYSLRLVLDIRTLPVDSNYIKKKINGFLFKESLKTAADHFHGITYITDEMRRYCIDKYNLPEHKAAVWSSGVDVEMFKPLHLPGNNKKFRLIYHGKFDKNRGLDNVVKAFDKLRNYDIEFFLLGSGEETIELKSLVHKLKLDKVNILAPVPYKEVPRYINSADAGILPFPQWPGWNASSPIKLFEYLACGKPVIVTKIPAHVKVLSGRSFAFWAENSSPESIVEAILEAYENKRYFKKLGKEARSFVKMNYTWEKQLSKLERFLV